MLTALVPLSTSRMRRAFWSRHRSFQAVHVAIACVLVPTCAAHVITAGHFVHGPGRIAWYVALSGAALFALLRARANSDPPANPPSLLSRMVFSRHSRKILVLVVAASLATVAMLSRSSVLVLREPVVARAAPLKVDFPHDRHREVNCIECHHNFVDRTGNGGCFSCHRSGRAELRLGAEARFHDFCLGCHRDPRPAFEHHGPTTGCSSCHLPSARSTRTALHTDCG